MPDFHTANSSPFTQPEKADYILTFLMSPLSSLLDIRWMSRCSISRFAARPLHTVITSPEKDEKAGYQDCLTWNALVAFRAFIAFVKETLQASAAASMPYFQSAA